MESSFGEAPAADVSFSSYPLLSIANRLKQQNQKLKSELQQLQQAMQEALKVRRKTSDTELQSLQTLIQGKKREAMELRVQLGSQKDMSIQTLENQVAYLKKILQQQEYDHNGYRTIEKEQIKAIGSVFKSEDADSSIAQLNKEMEEIVDREKKVLTALRDGEAERKTEHSHMVALETKCRELTRRGQVGTQSTEMLELEKAQQEEKEEWERKVKVLEKTIKGNEHKHSLQCKRLEASLVTATQEAQERVNRISALDEGIQVKQLKIKELKTREQALKRRYADLKATRSQTPPSKTPANLSTSMMSIDADIQTPEVSLSVMITESQPLDS